MQFPGHTVPIAVHLGSRNGRRIAKSHKDIAWKFLYNQATRVEK